VVLAMFAATISFAVSLWYSHSLLLPLDERALAILENSVPSIEHLAQARLSLKQIDSLAARSSPRGADDATANTQLQAARRELTSELQQYRSLPTSAEERRLLSELDAQLLRINDAAAASLAGAQVAAQPLMRAAALLARLERVNANEALSSAGEILVLRRRTALIATLLGLGSLGVAVAALLMALIVLRGQARLMDRHAALLTERGAELEAFSGRVAHDLRDPLGAIALGIQVAKKESQPAASPPRALQLVERQIRRMNDIIDDLLEFARAGASPSAKANADLQPVLNDVIETLRPKAAIAEAQLDLEPFDSVQVACTQAALSVVAGNLIGNAVKYIVDSPQAVRRIRVVVKRNGGRVRIEVIDNGPGLPSGAEQLIFEPFARLPETKQPGIGLGLATVKKLVEAYGGSVGVTSRSGEGSTFWVEIPMASARPLTH
jgi:signal transduction histidine kinase